jgi:uncharacterized iron-regulated membrane protein
VRLERRFWPVLRRVHAWAGLASCAFLAVLGLTGALLVFEDPLLRATVPGAAQPPVVDAAGIAAAAEAAERTFGAERIRSMTLASERFGLHELRLADGRGAWLDPRSHGVVEAWEPRGRLGEWLFDLHHELLAGKTGKTIAGWIGVVALLLTLTGVAYWARNGFRRARGWPARYTRAELDAAHRTWGAAFALPLIVVISSGVALALPEVARPLIATFTGKASLPPKAPRDAAARDGTRWERALQAAQGKFPDATARILIWPADGRAPSVRLRRAEEWHANGRTQLWFAAGTGEPLASYDALAAPAGARFYDLLWPVHASRVGGLAWQVGTFFSGLALMLLSLAGAAGWLKDAGARRTARAPGTVAAERR